MAACLCRSILGSLLPIQALTLIPSDGGPSAPDSPRVIVCFRHDGVSSISDVAREERIVDIFRRFNASLTVGCGDSVESRSRVEEAQDWSR